MAASGSRTRIACFSSGCIAGFRQSGQVLTITRPETLLRWHRTGFRCYWRWKSRPRGGRPQIDTERCLLIRRMSVENPLWGAPPIHGELLKLGFKVAQLSVAKYMAKRRGPPSHARHGHPREACRTSLAPAEWRCRTTDRVDPARVFGSCGDLGRGAFASDPEILRRYYNETRTHLALDKVAPVSRPVQRTGVVKSLASLGGLHHHYLR